jgi:hypothetical protein
MLTQFTTGLLDEWKTDFEQNPQLPSVTTSALINLKDLEDFIAAIKQQQADSVRVYFLRFKNGEPPFPPILVNGVAAKGCEWVKADDRLTQATIALVPARNFKFDKDFVFSADDIVVGNEVITLLPGTANEGTGLNPPGSSGGKTGG